MGRHRAAWTTALAIALALLAAGTASAFQFKGCVSQDGNGPCASIGNTSALNVPTAVAVTPDGRHVYSAAFAGDAIGVFARDPNTGGLSFQSCVSANGAGPCTIIRPGGHLRALDGPRALAISPDGKHVYAAAGEGDAISVFSRNADTGALGFAGCMTTNNEVQGVCIGIHNDSLNNPFALAISPDGDEVYVTAADGDAIGYYARNADTGLLAFYSCRGPASAPCTPVPNSGALDFPSALTVSPDGRFLYGAARDGDAIAVFRPDNALNQLSYLGCLAATAAGGCTPIGNSNALDAPASLVASTDNKFLFVAARDGNAIGAFARNQDTGALAFAGCDGATNVGPCTAIGNGNALTGPSALAVGPAGTRVYSAAASGNAVGSSARGGDGDPLGFVTCISSNGSGPCGNAGNGNALSGPEAVAASADGRHLYTAAQGGNAIGIFGVAPPACSPVTTSTPFQTAVRVQLQCGDPDGGDHVSFAAGGPANGTLSDLSGNSVLFTPNSGFFGQGIFDFTASDIDGAASARATINVGAPPPRPRRMNQTIKTRFAFNRTHTWILRMQVLKVPGDAKIQVRCKAPKRLGKKACPFKRKTLKPKRHRATVDVKKNAFRKKKRKLRAGVRIQLRITAPGAIGKVVTYKLRPNKLPRTITRCLPPGATKPQKRC